VTTQIANPRLLTDAVLVLLRTLPDVTVYDGEVDPEPPVIDDGTNRILPYAVVYATPGQPRIEELSLVAPTDLDWTVQVTVAGGYQPDTLQAIHRVRLLLEGRAMTVAGTSCGMLAQVNNPGPITRDDDIQPPRFYSPLAYQLIATS
jgi:hypothetical protein